MNIDSSIIERVKSINWFSNCGEPLKIEVNYPIHYLKDLKKAIKQCQGRYWEEITLEAQNDLSQFLHDNYREKYTRWNNYTKEAREVYNEYVSPKINEFINTHNLPLEFSHSVFGDIVLAMVEYTYRNEREPQFFMGLLKVYESGNFPCGWKGSWPDGKLIVY